MSDLVKDLREYRVGCGLHCDSSDAGEPLAECLQAADRIEALEAENERLQRDLAEERAKHALTFQHVQSDTGHRGQ